jgi:hypothetical protein
MSGFHDFLTLFFNHRKIAFRPREAPQDRPTERDVAVLAEAFETSLLSMAGPPVEFDAQVAIAGAEFVRQASWALVNRDDRLADLRKRVMMPGSPTTPAHHLSADLMLRHAPQLMKRAQGLDATDPLVELCGEVMRRWPLSGVMSDLEVGPEAPLDFSSHPGLLLLYAERLAANDRPAWRPDQSSKAWEYYELVLQDRLRGEATVRSSWRDFSESPGSQMAVRESEADFTKERS